MKFPSPPKKRVKWKVVQAFKSDRGCSHSYIFCYQIKKPWVFSKLPCTFMYIWHETLNMLQAINSLKNVDSTALLQFLHPILNMLLHLVGNGGETLQVSTKIFHFLSVCSPSPSKCLYTFPLAYDYLASPCYTDLLTVYGYMLLSHFGSLLQVAAFRAMVNILTRYAIFSDSDG